MNWIDCKERLPDRELIDKFIIALINNIPICVKVVDDGICISNFIIFYNIKDQSWKTTIDVLCNVISDLRERIEKLEEFKKEMKQKDD